MKVQLHIAGVVAVVTFLCGASQALPPSRHARQDTLSPCVQQCVTSIIESGACDDSPNLTQCICQVPTLQSCVQSSCPPSFVDPTTEYCGLDPSGSASSSQLFTIQTDTEAYLTKSLTATASTRRTASARTTGTFNPSSAVSPRISPTITVTPAATSAATTSAAPVSSPASSGNAAAPKADLPCPWKGLLVAGLGMIMAVAVA
ncbi:hypothetical protein M407DRAFT_121067 [Tulasnella calospora MUT 4182]|uniref:Extracellular membrane protein CFEM domain-containing protein n=1 Tax=Tulasnella calospora MUT 4182 TaxID=1051891 RepID=A0A0C3LKZ6_9AGAM|nr:hypothetical protein M407DRAFT_121067 [Tulasnella calospora MUT 4182]